MNPPFFAGCRNPARILGRALASGAPRSMMLLMAAPLLASLTGCGAFSAMPPEDREALASCRADADRVFAARNRYQLSERDQSAAPNAENTLPYAPSSGLSDKYEQQQMVDSCMARSAAGQPASH